MTTDEPDREARREDLRALGRAHFWLSTIRVAFWLALPVYAVMFGFAELSSTRAALVLGAAVSVVGLWQNRRHPFACSVFAALQWTVSSLWYFAGPLLTGEPPNVRGLSKALIIIVLCWIAVWRTRRALAALERVPDSHVARAFRGEAPRLRRRTPERDRKTRAHVRRGRRMR